MHLDLHFRFIGQFGSPVYQFPDIHQASGRKSWDLTDHIHQSDGYKLKEIGIGYKSFFDLEIL
jgi:hypothetical protein